MGIVIALSHPSQNFIDPANGDKSKHVEYDRNMYNISLGQPSCESNSCTTEQDIRNEIELETLRRERSHYEQLIKVDEEIVRIYEDSIQHNPIDVDLLNADRAKRDSLRAIINPV